MSSSVATRFPVDLLSDLRSESAGPSTEEKKTDESLIASLCNGDKDSLACLFRRYARLVRAVGYKILQDDSEAEDLLQEVFLFIYRKCYSFDNSKSSARSWIVQVTYHRAIDRRRYLQSRHFYTQIDIDEILQTPDGVSMRAMHEASAMKLRGVAGLQESFEALSENQRQTLQLHFFEGYTLDEIAAKLQQTRGNIKNHYFRGLDKLRKQIFACNSRGH